MKEKRAFVPRVKRPYIGTYAPRTDGLLKASGMGKYSQDLALKRKYPDMVYMKILKCPYPHAIIRRMDTSKAEAVPGFVGLLRYDDPEVRAMKPFNACWTDATHSSDSVRGWGDGCNDRVVLSQRGLWVGDEMGAAVAAETIEAAEEALKLIEVEWEQRPFVLTIEDSLKEDAPVLHPEVNAKNNYIPNYPQYREWGPDIMVDNGNTDAAFEAAEVVVSGETHYHNPQQCALDYWNCLMEWVDDQLICISDSYAVDQQRIFLSEMFGLPLTSVRCISPLEGGQHGRANAGEQPFFLVSALMAKKTGRPVRYVQTRKEHFHDTRTESLGKIKVGARKDGTIEAVEMSLFGNAGAYGEITVGEVKTVPAEWIELMLGGIPNVRFSGWAVYTNIIPSGCMRSIGNIEMNFLFGLGIELLAEKLNMDPVEIYKKNITCEGSPLPNECVTGVLDEGARLIGWKDRHAPGAGPLFEGTKKRGLGVGFNNSWHTEYQEFRRGDTQVMIKLNHDGTVILNAPTVEVGGGSSTCATLACADTLGVPYDSVRWIYQQDTETGLKDVVQTDSSVSFILAEATHDCALELKDDFLSRVALKWGLTREELDMKEGIVFEVAKPEHRCTIKEFFDTLDLINEDSLVPITHMVSRKLTKKNYGATYMATFAEVEVDTETGFIDVLHLLICSDGGTVLFPAGAEGQLAGGQVQGLGEALYEEMLYDDATGIPLNFNFVDYKFPTIADFPDIDPIPMEIYQGHGEYGASGMGEAAPCCTPRAIANAIYNAIGIRIDETAISPIKILNAMGKEGE